MRHVIRADGRRPTEPDRRVPVTEAYAALDAALPSDHPYSRRWFERALFDEGEVITVGPLLFVAAKE